MILQAINGINQMPLHKTRGVDGFPTEFFRCFGTELAPLLVRCTLNAVPKGERPGVSRTFVIGFGYICYRIRTLILVMY